MRETFERVETSFMPTEKAYKHYTAAWHGKGKLANKALFGRLMRVVFPDLKNLARMQKFQIFIYGNI